jgi:predicted metal-dependent hydrolase
MNLIQESFQQLFPNKTLNYQTLLKYNKKLGDFNGNIKLLDNFLQVNMNYKWKEIDQEIQIGLIQTLLLKMFAKRYRYKEKTPTFNINLYNNFVKKIPLLTPKTKTHPILENSFHRVNQQFFHELLDRPNLQWGTASKAKLACYNFHNDTITVSTIFKDAPDHVLDYLIYHELLHKKQKFQFKNNRNYFHTKRFRQAEDLFPNKNQIDKEINKIIRQHKTIKRYSFFTRISKTFK